MPTISQLPVASTLGVNDLLPIVQSGQTDQITGAVLLAFVSANIPTGFTWNIQTSSITMSPSNGYITNSASLVLLTLPAASAVGQQISILGKGIGGWKIVQGASQQINLGNSSTTVGTSGFLASTNANDSLVLICTVANTVWSVLGGPQGNITVN